MGGAGVVGHNKEAALEKSTLAPLKIFKKFSKI
jgi:hypothetical protein